VAAAGGQVVVEQGQLPAADLGEHGLLDAAGDAGRGGDHGGGGVGAPAGDVDQAGQLAAGGVVDGGAGAGQVLQVLDVVLVAEHLGRAVALQRGADAVGAGELLGVAEPGGEGDLVELVLQPGVAGAAVEDHAVAVGE